MSEELMNDAITMSRLRRQRWSVFMTMEERAYAYELGPWVGPMRMRVGFVSMFLGCDRIASQSYASSFWSWYVQKQ